MSLKPGDKAPNIALRTVEGQMLSLHSDQQEERSTLLIFLRHLG